MPDFSELAKYLAEQIDIGESSVILDEPWTLSPVRMSQPVNAPQPISAPSPAPFSQPQRSSFSTPAPAPAKPRVFNPAPAKIIIPESAKSAVPSAYENAKTLEEFYSLVAAEKLYAKTQFIRGEGKLNAPRVLLVVYSPLEKYLTNGYVNSDVGQMILRMFESLHVTPEEIAVTYFCKKVISRMVLPQVAAVFKKMLEKEIALMQPTTVIFFGDKLLKQALAQNALKVVDFGGTPLEFAGKPATALIDPEEMFANKQLKLVTWKIQIPKCKFFS
ncbi:MAG: hypothetical protein SOZ02_03270 [Hallerella porci]|uniref:hypothetical protein n=1 Tax=Hallerella TaxID=2815788 RepID=UPI000D04ADBF|nr:MULTISPECIES: hypothetical protein [Hallerella]MCI5600650.1 hypothetical protein [Hallerella sp.]MDY3921166.1 hypothetical protein [Hallerella porci]